MANRQTCALMFSGGRDSTLAAVRLMKLGYELLLITVVSEHLVGVEAVTRRLRELHDRSCIAGGQWLLVEQPMELSMLMQTHLQTCLPCHTAYAGVGLRIAIDGDVQELAFGYTGYQSSWLEQAPPAIAALTHQLERHGIDLLLPVLDLESKQAAIMELRANGLCPDALEQKCLQQQFNASLGPEQAHAETDRWECALASSFAAARNVDLRVLQRVEIDDLGAIE